MKNKPFLYAILLFQEIQSYCIAAYIGDSMSHQLFLIVSDQNDILNDHLAYY